MQSTGGLIWSGLIVSSIAMMALISFQPSVVLSTGSRSGAAQKPLAQLTKGTPAGRLVRCGRMIADRNPDPLMNRGPFFVQGWEQIGNGKAADEPGTVTVQPLRYV
ncbi:hypothetical protein H4Q26_005655 [Puccinia striiformis f. sp. tritici PST-130]|nr:hypothetical protein H4Q26_005655 [Puccinia striiformis f. sp. tritici PST-130]